jgi:hypothetical protein
MPTIITRGAASTRGYGLLNSSRVIAPDTAIRSAAANTTSGQQSTTTVSLLSGYSAGIYIYMVGDGSAQGNSFPYDCGHSSAGEFAQFAYTCTGAETGLTVAFNINGAGSHHNILRVTVNGGANNGTYAQVGSYANSCGYGDAAPSTSRSSGSSGVFTRVTYGAYAVGEGRYYSDDYYYSPCGYSYGSGQNGYSADTYSNRGRSNGCSAGTPGAVWIQYRNNYA